MIKRIVQVVQALALLCAIVFVVALFANEPTTPSIRTSTSATTTAGGGGGSDVPGGEAIFKDSCASCHGADGGGAFGPKLSDGRVVERFPDVADQLKVVQNGRGGMPAFKTKLSQAEIDAVVAYTRTL